MLTSSTAAATAGALSTGFFPIPNNISSLSFCRGREKATPSTISSPDGSYSVRRRTRLFRPASTRTRAPFPQPASALSPHAPQGTHDGLTTAHCLLLRSLLRLLSARLIGTPLRLRSREQCRRHANVAGKPASKRKAATPPPPPPPVPSPRRRHHAALPPASPPHRPRPRPANPHELSVVAPGVTC